MTKQEEELSRPTDMTGDADVVVCSSRHAVRAVSYSNYSKGSKSSSKAQHTEHN